MNIAILIHHKLLTYIIANIKIYTKHTLELTLITLIKKLYSRYLFSLIDDVYSGGS